jgi:hypothetical protein
MSRFGCINYISDIWESRGSGVNVLNIAICEHQNSGITDVTLPALYRKNDKLKTQLLQLRF